MAKNDFPKVTPATSYPLGHAKENKDASVYAKNGTSVANSKAAVTKSGSWIDNTNISLAAGSKGNYAPDNKYGEKTMRGYGAATKGIKTRGPMA
jgi:hypothetical protein